MEELSQRVIDLAISIQQIPAPTFSEGERARFLQQLFQEEGLLDVLIDSTGNIYGCLPGAGKAPPLVVSAHMDTVFPLNTDLLIRRENGKIYGPGIGDNSVGVASLLGLLWGIRAEGKKLPGDLWLVGNTGEEGLGDLVGMRAVVERFSDAPLAYVVLEGMALGQVYHRGLGVRRYRISVETQGGHSWVNYGNSSAIHEIARLITRFTQLPISSEPRASLNVGVLHGGTSVNTIASHASLELDLRSENSDTLKQLISQVMSLVDRSTHENKIRITCEKIGDRPSGEIPPDHPLIKLGIHCLQAQGLEPQLNISSTDANIPFSLGLPAICIGMTSGGGAHTTGEFIDTRPLKKGLAQLIMLVSEAFHDLGHG